MAENQDSRADIKAWYSDAKSVLLCAFSYAGPRADPPAEGRGRVARYARAQDYHEPLRARLKEILAWLKGREPSAHGVVFTDTSPLLERLYARNAALGWIGKNTMLISPKLGSYFFLGGIALNLELPADEAETDHCGSCTRCLDACPTDAFPKERVLDASKCIAYYNIEHRGDIPEEFQKGIGDWVLGCDVCQEVCPWQRFGKEGSVLPASVPASVPLDELLDLTWGQFKKRYGDTPLARARKRSIERNALLAMGNSGDPKWRPVLERYASHAHASLARQARLSLARLPAPAQDS
jgi:epoxyqueuosine reductase